MLHGLLKQANSLRSPVLISCKNEWKYLKKTVLFYYCFSWGENYEHSAIALGYGSLYNHSYTKCNVYL